MTIVDILIGIILLIGMASGLARGFVRSLFGLAALVLGIVVAGATYSWLAERAFFFVPGDRGPEVIGFLAAFLVVLMVISFLGRLVSKALKLAALGWLDRLAGGVLGLGIAAAFTALLLLLVVTVFKGAEKRDSLAGSALANKTLAVSDAIVSVVPEDVRERFEGAYDDVRDRWDREQRRRERAARDETDEASEGRPEGAI